jgi:signal transduction histidine kinase
LRIRAGDESLTIEVLDDGTSASPVPSLPAGGNGLAGMRERAASVGGNLSAGPRPGRGFAVRAELPLNHST